MEHPTAALDYDLPGDAIAQEAIEPRDASRLLVTSSLSDHSFQDLPTMLDPGDLLVVNRTRVRRARLDATRCDTGGRIEVLLLDRRMGDRWRVMLRPARRMRRDQVLVAADDEGRSLSIRLVSDPVDGVAEAILDTDGDVEAIVDRVGAIPLPPYFHGTLPNDDRYQTLFAARVGSAAAPTAALHFTTRLVADLETRGISFAAVELEVGLDTFRPIAVADLDDHRIHTERYDVPEDAAAAIDATRRDGGRVVAVGTTVVRTLESAADGSVVMPGPGTAEIFIMPGYRLAVVDSVITNFHAPRTTLIALVATLLGDRWRTAYETALARGYRFLSFGDAMLIDDIDPAARRPR